MATKIETTRVKTTDLKPGMRLAGRQPRTVAGVTTHLIDGGGEFDDYTICIVHLKQEMYAANRGKIAQHAEFAPDALHTVIVDAAVTA